MECGYIDPRTIGSLYIYIHTHIPHSFLVALTNRVRDLVQTHVICMGEVDLIHLFHHGVFTNPLMIHGLLHQVAIG
jgi:hypothetical protein